MRTKNVFHVLVCAAVLGFALALHSHTVTAQETEGNYATVNGLNLYYEIHGEGDPLILLHGGLGGIPEFAGLLPLLAESRQVIAVELQGHGRTADIDRPMSYEQLADDIAALIEQLGYERADVMGYSLGGGVALQTAIRHPEVVRKLVLISTPMRRDAIHPEFLGGMSSMNPDMMLETPMYQFYSSVAPNVDDWPVLVGKVGEMLAQDYDWSEDVAGLTMPVLLLAADSDEFPPTHAAEMFALLGGGVPADFVGAPASQLAVLPGTSHFTILSRADLLLPLITPFLEAPLPEGA